MLGGVMPFHSALPHVHPRPRCSRCHPPCVSLIHPQPMSHTPCSKYDSMDNGMFDGVPLTALIANRTAKDMLWHRRHVCVYGLSYAHVYACVGQAMHICTISTSYSDLPLALQARTRETRVRGPAGGGRGRGWVSGRSKGGRGRRGFVHKSDRGSGSLSQQRGLSGGGCGAEECRGVCRGRLVGAGGAAALLQAAAEHRGAGVGPNGSGVGGLRPGPHCSLNSTSPHRDVLLLPSLRGAGVQPAATHREPRVANACPDGHHAHWPGIPAAGVSESVCGTSAVNHRCVHVEICVWDLQTARMHVLI